MANNAVNQTFDLNDPLENHSLWYKYKKLVWGRETPESAAVHNTMRTLRSIRLRAPLAYISTPVTSGSYYYKLRKETNEVDMKAVMAHNYNLGRELTDKVLQRRMCSALLPAELVPARQRWKQEDFQALWLSIIAEFCTEVHMSYDWHMSNGAIEELIHVFQLKLGVPESVCDSPFYNTKGDESDERERMKHISLFDHQGNAISTDEAARQIEKGMRWLINNHFPTDHHRNCLATLLWTREKIKEGYYK